MILVIGIACRSLILIKNEYFIYFLPKSKLIYGCSDTTNLNCRWVQYIYNLQGMVIRVAQCAKFEAISSIMHGTPQFDQFHQFKIGQDWRIERRKIPRLPGSLDHYSAPHSSDVIMSAMAFQITGVLIVYSTVCSGEDQRKHQNSASLVCVREIHRWPVNSPQSPVNSPHKSQWRGTCFHLMTSSWKQEIYM